MYEPSSHNELLSESYFYVMRYKEDWAVSNRNRGRPNLSKAMNDYLEDAGF